MGDAVVLLTQSTLYLDDGLQSRDTLMSIVSRPESSSGNSAGLKVKSKASKVLDLDDHDDTNYEMLAKSSPHKNARGDELDSFLGGCYNCRQYLTLSDVSLHAHSRSDDGGCPPRIVLFLDA